MRFIKDLVSTIGSTLFKKDVFESLEAVTRELEENTIPLYDDLLIDFSNWQFKSNEVNQFIPTFKGQVRRRNGNIIVTTHACLKIAARSCNDLLDHVESEFKNVTSKEVITYRKAQMLKFVNMVGFFSQYSRRLANYILVAETSQYDPGNTIKTRLTGAQRKYVEQNIVNFFSIMNILSTGSKNIIGSLKNIPDIIVDGEKFEATTAVLKPNQIDPLSMGFIPAAINPFFRIGKMIAEYQVRRYNEMVEEEQLIRLRLQNLKKEMDRKPDPHLQKEIELYEARVQQLSYKLRQLEDEYMKED